MSWEYQVGLLPHKVTAYEDSARRGVIYLKWRTAGDWSRKSLGFRFTRDTRGRIPKAETDRAQRAADEQYARLLHGGHVPLAPVAALTIADGWALAKDVERGKWTEDTMHRREMERAVNRAKSVWGARTAWNAIDRGDVRRLWRAELKRVRATGKPGVRSAEIVVARVMALAEWLREEGKIARIARNASGEEFAPCAPWKGLKDEMARDCSDYEPKRLRYTLAEYRALLVAAPAVDERFGLLLAIGAEYRLGQVVRAKRSHLQLDTNELKIAGAGKKRGTVVVLTPAQRAAIDAALSRGYLAGLETAYQAKVIADYPLFVGGNLPWVDDRPITQAKHATRAPLTARPLRNWLRETEAIARVDDAPIAHVEGRGWYGLRRAAVDAAKAAGISREGLQQSGGWANTQIPDGAYADQEARYAAEEAARVRARIRGELPSQTDQNGASPATSGEACEPSTEAK